MSAAKPSLAVNSTGAAAGSPILFLHGATWAGISWHQQLAAFSADHHCITVDLPGHGDSRHIAWTTIDDAADAVAAVVADCCTERVVCVGFSLGADVALRLLARHPNLVASLVVTGAITKPDSQLNRVLDVATWPMVRLPVVHNIISRQMRLPARTLADYLRSSEPMRIRDFGLLSRQVLAGVSIDELANLTTPVLALAGRRESRLARESAAAIADFVGTGFSAEIPRGGHEWFVKRPELFNRVLAEWISAPDHLPGPLQRGVQSSAAV